MRRFASLAAGLLIASAAAAAEVPSVNWTSRESRHYEQRWNGEIGRSHRICRAIGFVLRSPRLLRAAARIAHCRPVIAEQVAQLVVSA